MTIKDQIENVIKTIQAQLKKAEDEKRDYKDYVLDREEAIHTLKSVLAEEEMKHDIH